jgi:hypothetical protein
MNNKTIKKKSTAFLRKKMRQGISQQIANEIQRTIKET